MKPIPLVGNIPAELKDRRQWVAWRYEERDGRLTKIPKNPQTGGNASSTEPDTWGSIQEALIATETYGLDGIGFMFSESDPYAGVDLDSCLNPETGELEPWARRWVDLFQSYTEVTPSGRGLHIILRGKLPEREGKTGTGRKKGKFEVYDRQRFFTFTGNVLNGNGSDSIPTE
jgi:primase-polymerase (primpol)-like protein